jgi:hypothetical protein
MQSEIIFKNQWYTACAMRDGSLIVTRNRGKQSGVRLVGESAPHWIESIRTADDAKEAHMLCRACLD